MTVSVFATMFLFSLAGLSTSLLQTEGAARQRNYALAGAEAGLDFARKKLNESLLNGESSDIEPQAGEPYRDYGLPVQYIPQLGNRCRVMIRLTPVSDANLLYLAAKNSPAIPTEINTALRKDAATDWKWGDDWRAFAIPDPEEAPSKSYCWKVEVTSYCGIFATSIRSVMVGAFPNTYMGPPTSPKDMFFSQGISSDGAVELGNGGDGNSTVIQSSGDSQIVEGNPNSFVSVIQTNSQVTANPNTTVVGDLKVTNPDGANNAVANGNPTSLIEGRVDYNSVLDGGNDIGNNGFVGATPSDPTPANQNVNASADIAPYGTNADKQGINRDYPVLNQPAGSTNQQSPNPVPTPSDTFPLPSFPTPPPDGATPSTAETSVQSGLSYKTGTFDSTDATSPLIFNEVAADTPTKIFVEDSLASNNSNAIKIDSSMVLNKGDASALQVYYGGTKPIQINLDGATGDGVFDLKMLIYAPNAPVLTTGRGDFKGSIVGKSVAIKHIGTMQLDPTASQVLADRRNSGANGPGSGTGSHSRTPTYYRMMTWQQVSGSIVPLD
jgi:hypothetical protein